MNSTVTNSVCVCVCVLLLRSLGSCPLLIVFTIWDVLGCDVNMMS